MHVDRHILTDHRAGFTLIELLVVMLIIAILAGLSWAVLGRTGTTARVAATRTTLQQLDSLLAERIEAFRRHDFRNQAAAFRYAYNNVGSPPNATANLPQQAAERMVRKNAFRGSFPSRFEDLFGLDGVDGDVGGSNSNFVRDWAWGPLPGTPHLEDEDFDFFGMGDDAQLALTIRQLRDSGEFNPEYHDPATESSELLYLALTRGATYGVPLDSLDNIDADRFQDTDEDGLIEILDDWGHPIRFYNYPTALMRADTNLGTFVDGAAAALIDDVPPGSVDWTNVTDYTSPLKQDPDDPFGELAFYFNTYELDFGSGANPMLGFGQTDPAVFSTDQGIVDVLGLPSRYHISNTWHRPLLVSVGPNEELGLGEPTAMDASRFASADLTDGAGGTVPNGVIDTAEIEAFGDNITNRQQAGGN